MNEEQEDSANDYNMWPYERPEDIAVEIYFVGAVLLDTTALLFGRPEEPLQLTASSYPYGIVVVLSQFTQTLPNTSQNRVQGARSSADRHVPKV